LLGDVNEDAAAAAAEALAGSRFNTSTATVDVASHESVRALANTATALGDVVHVVHTAGLSPAQASPEAIIAVDLVGVAFVLEEFGRVIAPGGSGVVIASQAGHMIPHCLRNSTRRWPQPPPTNSGGYRSSNPTS
jgi:Enoyl-(Acyl carrier protein) reductase